MKILLNRFKNNAGQSYIEFMIMFLVIISIFYTAFECFWIINAQILVINTTKSALRQVEIYGEYNSDIQNIIIESLGKIKNLNTSSVQIRINDNLQNGYTQRYQYRTPIKFSLSVDYNLFLFRKVGVGERTKITLSSSYHGASQRLYKDNPSLPIPEYITEN